METPFAKMLTAEAVAGRLARKASFVVWVEMPSNVFELDADDAAHASKLASVWMRREFGAVSASARQVRANGSTKCLEVLGVDHDA